MSLIDCVHSGNLPNGSPVHRVDFEFIFGCTAVLWRYVGSVDLQRWILHFRACSPFWKPNSFLQTSIFQVCIGEPGSISYGPPFWIIVCRITSPSRFSWCSTFLLPDRPPCLHFNFLLYFHWYWSIFLGSTWMFSRSVWVSFHPLGAGIVRLLRFNLDCLPQVPFDLNGALD